MSDLDPPDRLLEQAIAGDQAALIDLLMDEQSRLSRRIARKLPTSLARTISSEDVMQDVFRRAFQHFPAFQPSVKPVDSFHAWLQRIADNAVRDALRRHRSAKRGGGRGPVNVGTDRSSVLSLVDLVMAHQRTPSRSMSRLEMAAAMQSAFEALREDDRKCLKMRYLDGLPVSDVADRLNRTETAAQKLCLRALDRLREAFEANSGITEQGQKH